MLDLSDQRWSGLTAGYRTPIDLRPLLDDLENGADTTAAWDRLWQELYHQGDIGEGSFAAVPHLIRIHRKRNKVDWNTYALVATIELARGFGSNPEVPDWMSEDYEDSLQTLGRVALEELTRAEDKESVRSILGFLAVVHGARAYGQVMIEYGEDEIQDVLDSEGEIGRKG